MVRHCLCQHAGCVLRAYMACIQRRCTWSVPTTGTEPPMRLTAPSSRASVYRPPCQGCLSGGRDNARECTMQPTIPVAFRGCCVSWTCPMRPARGGGESYRRPSGVWLVSCQPRMKKKTKFLRTRASLKRAVWLWRKHRRYQDSTTPWHYGAVLRAVRARGLLATP